MTFLGQYSSDCTRKIATFGTLFRAPLRNALVRSCQHQIQVSFVLQVGKLFQAGFPAFMLCGLAGKLLSEQHSQQTRSYVPIVNRCGPRPPVCTKKHASAFVECTKNVVYEIAFKYARVYVGQTSTTSLLPQKPVAGACGNAEDRNRKQFDASP